MFTYVFDSASRLTGVQNPQGERTTWAYDALSRVTTTTYANTATVTYSYDAASRTTGVRNAKADGTAIAGFVYTLDGVGNPAGMVLSNGDRVTWSYDSLYRLTREQRSGANAYDITYTYDATSNRLTKLASGTTTTYAYDNADALLTENAGGALTTYTWDDVGNNTLVQSAGGTTTMTWDGENRMKTIQLAASVVTSTYGFDGLRRKRDEGATTVKYMWDDERLLLESDGSDVTQALYTSSLGAYGDVVSQRRGATTSYLHPDHLGTIWAVTGSDQSTTDTYVFDAWGNQLASTGSTTNPHRYVGALGYYTEPSLSLDYVRARWLRPATGSWVSADPLSPTAGWAYGPGRVLHLVDPSGLIVESENAICGADKWGIDGRFVYTCGCGWLDFDHFDAARDLAARFYDLVWDENSRDGSKLRRRNRTFQVSAWIRERITFYYSATFRMGPRSMPRRWSQWRHLSGYVVYQLQYNLEVMQWWAGFVPIIGGRPLISAFSYEDLPSNWVGVHAFTDDDTAAQMLGRCGPVLSSDNAKKLYRCMENACADNTLGCHRTFSRELIVESPQNPTTYARMFHRMFDTTRAMCPANAGQGIGGRDLRREYGLETYVQYVRHAWFAPNWYIYL